MACKQLLLAAVVVAAVMKMCWASSCPEGYSIDPDFGTCVGLVRMNDIKAGKFAAEDQAAVCAASGAKPVKVDSVAKSDAILKMLQCSTGKPDVANLALEMGENKRATECTNDPCAAAVIGVYWNAPANELQHVVDDSSATAHIDWKKAGEADASNSHVVADVCNLHWYGVPAASNEHCCLFCETEPYDVSNHIIQARSIGSASNGTKTKAFFSFEW